MFALFGSLALLASIVATDLRVNAVEDALISPQIGPTFSWKLKARENGAKSLRQSAYRIILASTDVDLRRDVGDLWDSGTVKSAATYGIRCPLLDLPSLSRLYWKVQVWDQDGRASDWSKVGTFQTGLGTHDHWGNWIHGNKPSPVVDALKDAEWIWAKDEAGMATPVATHEFRYHFAASRVHGGELLITADDEMRVTLNGQVILETSGVDSWRKVRVVDLSAYLRDGDNLLAVTVKNTSVSPAGLLAAIALPDQAPIVSGKEWVVDGTEPKVLGKNGMQPWGRMARQQFVVAPAQYFRRKFVAKGKVRRATLYGTALGIADFTANGKRVSEDLFTPGWTDYNKLVEYRAFDITKFLKEGPNELGAVLGQGWYAGYVAWGAQREHYGDTPMLWAQVEIDYADGSTGDFCTDATWECSEGPIRDEHFLHGEKYDARVKPTNWRPVSIGKPKLFNLLPFGGNPVREYQRLSPKSIRRIGPKKFVLDFGQNLSGFVQIRAKASRGTTVTIRHGERLDGNQNLYTENLRLAQAIDQYTFAGGGTEQWNPRFTFHGFQYIEVEGLAEAKPEMFSAIAISSDTPEVGTLKTSDPMLNQLVSNAWWTQKMNFVDVPTDCPQRDERLGWTGDAQAYIRTATYFSDVQAFFTRWLKTLDHAQRADGQYPQVAPVLKGLEDGGPAWSDAGVICPMTIYRVYGDKALLARHYPQMKKFIAFCQGRSKSNLLPPDNYHIFGDWLSINADTPKDIITTAYFAGSVALMIEAAEVLGHAGDVKVYRELHTRITEAFRTAYVDKDGRVQGDTQCGYVLALGFDLLTQDQAKQAANHLVKNIESRGWHLSTGFVGTRDLMDVLVRIGRSDVAFRLLHNKTFPSWGFPITHGATSIWERWDGWTPEKGFQDVGMNSFAHYAYGAVAGWMFKTIGGIDMESAGFGTIRIQPLIDPNLTWAECRYNSVHGVIRTKWKVTGVELKLEVEVPVNTQARVVLPNGEEHAVGSGRYEYRMPWPVK